MGEQWYYNRAGNRYGGNARHLEKQVPLMFDGPQAVGLATEQRGAGKRLPAEPQRRLRLGTHAGAYCFGTRPVVAVCAVARSACCVCAVDSSESARASW